MTVKIAQKTHRKTKLFKNIVSASLPVAHIWPVKAFTPFVLPELNRVFSNRKIVIRACPNPAEDYNTRVKIGLSTEEIWTR